MAEVPAQLSAANGDHGVRAAGHSLAWASGFRLWFLTLAVFPIITDFAYDNDNDEREGNEEYHSPAQDQPQDCGKHHTQ